MRQRSAVTGFDKYPVCLRSNHRKDTKTPVGGFNSINKHVTSDPLAITIYNLSCFHSSCYAPKLLNHLPHCVFVLNNKAGEGM